MTAKEDPLDLDNLRLSPEAERAHWAAVPRKIRRRREHFIMVPFEWLERLSGASGQVYALALHLLYLHWRNKGAPFPLANGMLKIDGISRSTKWWALMELERRGLISIERRPRKSPLIRVSSV